MGAIPLGEDILLARHGQNVVEFRQDRKNSATIAFLRGGQTDSASNKLSTGILVSTVRTPAEAMSQGAVSYLKNEAAVSRQEVRSLAKISLGFSALIGTVFGGLLLALYKIGGSDAIASLSNMSTGL